MVHLLHVQYTAQQYFDINFDQLNLKKYMNTKHQRSP